MRRLIQRSCQTCAEVLFLSSLSRCLAFHPYRHAHVREIPPLNTPIVSFTVKRLATVRGRRLSSSSTKPLSSEEDKLLADECVARKKRIGQTKHRMQRTVTRENRIYVLEQKIHDTGEISDAERAELNGLRQARSNFEEQYDPTSFSEEHVAFKRMHNDVLIALSRYCEKERNNSKINMFFLDGPDGGTATALIERGGFEPSQCYVANRHESSCNLLRISGGGRLPDENVVHATAAEALTKIDNSNTEQMKDENLDEGAFSDIDFAAYYFDGCGGYVPHVIGMMSAALLKDDNTANSVDKRTTAVGFSLLGGIRDVVEKELSICQALSIIARRRELRLVHALDDPTRFGIQPDVKKIGGSGGGGTFTTWLVLEDIDRTK